MLNDLSVLLAVVAAGGVALMWVAIATPRQVSLATRQQQESFGFLDRFKKEFESAGLTITFFDFLRSSLLVSLMCFIILMLLGYIVLAVVTAFIVPLVWYQFLLDKRDQNDREFKRSFSNIVINFSNMLAVRGSIEAAINTLAAEGDEETRKIFQRVIMRQTNPVPANFEKEANPTQRYPQQRTMRDALLDISREFNDLYARQFFRILADASVQGGDIRPSLESLAAAQRTTAGILAQVEAQQASTRVASVLYGPAPVIFLVLFSIIGDPEIYRAFYQTPTGYVFQAIVAASGVLGWVLARRLGRRGLYVQKNVKINKGKQDLL